MRLSVDNINKESPYWVIQLDDMQFRFRTSTGIVYHVGFYPDSYFMPGSAYHFYISSNNIHAPKDSSVFTVISLVIEEFFRIDSSIMLYICDSSDKRELTRANLYKRWFDNYPKKDSLILRTAEIPFKENSIYSGLIIRKDNPMSKLIIEAFDNFVELAPSLYSYQEK